MTRLRICLQSQTPLVRLLKPVPAGARLDALREGEDYLPSPGGVTRMLNGLLSELDAKGRLDESSWMSLAREPARLRRDARTSLEFVSMKPGLLERYAEAKGDLWAGLHELPMSLGLDVHAIHSGLQALARELAARLRELHRAATHDLLYVHDFQLLAAADEAPRRLPRVFRWHVPVTEAAPDVRDYVVRSMNKFDAIVVSTNAYAERLRRWGVEAPIHASYPYLGTATRRVVTSDDLARFDAKWGLREDDVAFVVVARLDPMKSQDVAIRALARLRDEPRAKLLLVGGGGFSGGRQGLGLPQAASWRESLLALARELRVEDRVVFTGNVPDEELDVAYARARAILLPSSLEGFGLAPVEGWARGRPVVVSGGAGAAELVRDGENGHTHAPGDDEALARRMRELLHDAHRADAMGARGRETARECSLARGADNVWRILTGVVEGGERQAARRPRWA